MTTPRSSDSEAAWEVVINSLQATLDAQRRAFAEARYADIVAYELPDNLGPVPPRLEARALDLLSECTALEIAVADRMESVTRRRNLLDRSSNDGPTAMFFDHSL
jgi:hypothetical protein